MKTKTIAIAAATLTLAGAVNAGKWPANVDYTEPKKGYSPLMTAVHYSYPATIDMESAAICIIGATQTDDVVLRDTSRAWVGQYTGNFYAWGDSNIADGGDGLKHISDEGMIVNGSTRYNTLGGLTQIAIRYDAAVRVHNGTITVDFGNIRRAQMNTGYAANAGFQQVPMSGKRRVGKILTVLEEQALKYKACANS